MEEKKNKKTNKKLTALFIGLFLGVLLLAVGVVLAFWIRSNDEEQTDISSQEARQTEKETKNSKNPNPIQEIIEGLVEKTKEPTLPPTLPPSIEEEQTEDIGKGTTEEAKDTGEGTTEEAKPPTETPTMTPTPMPTLTPTPTLTPMPTLTPTSTPTLPPTLPPPIEEDQTEKISEETIEEDKFPTNIPTMPPPIEEDQTEDISEGTTEEDKFPTYPDPKTKFVYSFLKPGQASLSKVEDPTVTEVEIPGHIGSDKVVTVDPGIFSSCASLETIRIREDVDPESGIFLDLLPATLTCFKLQEIILPKSYEQYITDELPLDQIKGIGLVNESDEIVVRLEKSPLFLAPSIMELMDSLGIEW